MLRVVRQSRTERLHLSIAAFIVGALLHMGHDGGDAAYAIRLLA